MTRASELITEYISWVEKKRGFRPLSQCSITNIRTNVTRILESDKSPEEYAKEYLKDKQKSTQSWWLCVMKDFYGWMELTGKLPVSPFKETAIKCPPKIPKETYDRTYYEKFDKIYMAPEQRLIYNIMVESGCRLSELRTITRDSLPKDGEAHLLRITGKGDKDRYVPIQAETLEKIRNIFANNPNQTYLFENPRTKESYSYRSLWLLIRDILITARDKFPGEASHIFRRSFITELHREGVQLPVIQAAVGHSNIMTTIRYVQVHKRDIEKLLDAELFKQIIKARHRKPEDEVMNNG